MISSISLQLTRLDQISGLQVASAPQASAPPAPAAGSSQTGVSSAAQTGFPALGNVILGQADGDENAMGGERNDGDADDMPQQQPVKPTFNDAGAYGFGAMYA